ncbi:VOC family protein [Paraburkholderia sp. D15]|uniref:VOC family protein n=1 Tax=Paraburkholderia sp. D15 TaxID=2880218 RepID=UPI0024788200|nr:VOC family protein [Paraburkholderia sp. D15]WGS51746.1 VOC family protein [Paraburkholderia sp. D15]
MNGFVPVKGLHHVAYRCRDAEDTRRFYEDILGLPLVHLIRLDTVPSTGERCPYVHVFFELGDGSCVAFFDLGDGEASTPSANTPPWVQHLALEVADLAALDTAKQRLVEARIDVTGPTDHGFVKSIYFRDPNGVRLELTAKTIPSLDHDAPADAHRALQEWTREKQLRAGHTAKIA